MTSLLPELDRLQAAASQTTAALDRMRIDKWKADNDSKRQAQANAESIQRNLNSALPGMISNVRSAPQDVGAEFKLYRNLNAVYDVMSSLTESAGAFGPRNDYQALSQQLEVVEAVRRSVGDALEHLTASTQSELDQLRTQVRNLQQAAAAAPPKRVVVDDTEPVKKPVTRKKKSTKPPANTGGPATSTTPPQI